jgi:hypothetical protein
VEELAGIVVAAHALLGAVFLGGLIGRWIVLGMAERADTLARMQTLTRAARPFERIVILGSQVVVVLGIVAAIAQGRPFLGPIQGAPVDWLFVSVILAFTVPVIVPLVFLPRGRVFEAAMAEATARDEITPALSAAWRDPVVRAAHVYELVAVSVVFLLMVAKPF